MKRIGHRTIVVYFVVGLFLLLLGTYIFQLVTKGEKWATYPMNKHIYTDGKLVRAGAVLDRNNVVLAKTEDGVRNYSENKNIRKATIHTLGDFKGNISGGIQSTFSAELSGFNLLNGTFSPDKKGNDIKLTLDSDLCVTALNAMGNYSGTVAVCNYKTGELLCVVSTKTYDPLEKVTDDDLENGIFLNRFIFGRYTPGSTFKLVTTACALENLDDIDDFKVKCDGGCYVDGEWVACSGNHGEVGLKDALAKSCNAYFAELTLKLGKAKMIKTAEEVGFNKTFKYEGNKVIKSIYNSNYSSKVNFAWSGIGQSTVLANPYQMLLFTSAIANGGKAKELYTVDSIKTSNGVPTSFKLRKTYNLLDEDIANELSNLMRNNVESQYGDWRFEGLEFCAKTGTAQIDDDEATSWIVGFSRREDKPYAIVVAVEKGGYGITKAGTIANKVLQSAPKID